MTPKSILTPRQLDVLRGFCKGRSVREIAEEYGISPSAVHLQCTYIRGKTGLQNIRDPAACRIALRESFSEGVRNPRDLSPTQLAVLKLRSQRLHYVEIASRLGLGLGTAMNHASQGKKRLGIAGPNIDELIAALVRRDPMDDPAFS